MSNEDVLAEAISCYCQKRRDGEDHAAASQIAYLVMTNYSRGTISRDGWERLTEAINKYGIAVASDTAHSAAETASS